MMMIPTMTTLSTLPPPSLDMIGDRSPWSTVNAKGAAALLGVDPATFNAWVYRGKGPTPVGARGRNTLYRLSAILAWLGRRNGLETTEEDIWREFLRTVVCACFADTLDDGELRDWIRSLHPAAQLD